MANTEIRVRALGEPGDLGWVVKAHGEIYAREFGWNTEFEVLVLQIVADFTRDTAATPRAAWIAERDRRRVGCVFCVPDDDPGVAKLRILLVDPAARGQRLGTRLVATALQFARSSGFDRVRLWTNHPLAAARRIYLDMGFTLVAEQDHDSFGVHLTGQTYELDLSRLQPTGNPGGSAPLPEDQKTPPERGF